jgi:NAD(P)-dependent dehydrogenase (short-subunit alcohol dehydrogenase family)
MTMLARLPPSYRALVLGASGTLGSAFVRALRADARCATVQGLSRSGQPALILEQEDSLREAAAAVAPQGPYHLIIDATGALTIDGRGPEKRLAELDATGLARSFQINAIGRALLLKHFIPLLAPRDQASILAVLSARVGSIADNRLGGWYGYRAAKAAGNMLLQTAAIEAQRSRPLAVFAALQPGTVASPLSAPFNAGHALTDADASVAGLLQALGRLEPAAGARFIDHRGLPIPW